MIFNVWFVLVGALLVFMALSSTLLKHLPLTTSILYFGVGIVLSPIGFGLIRFDPLQYSEALERLTEVAVVVSLFTAGLKMRVPFTDRRWLPPIKLATLTMVASVGMVTALAVYLLHLPLGAAILLGAILAPTDPVLASDVQVEHPTDRDRLRFSLTGEAGLNDGTAFPFVMLGLGVLGYHQLGDSGLRWLGVDLVWAVVGGLAIGWIFGQLIGRVTVHLRRRKEQAVGYEDFLALGLIALAYGVALLAHAYGFLAVFAAGVALRHVEMQNTGQDREPEEVINEVPETDETKLSTHPEAAPVYMAHAVLGFSEQAERILEFSVVLVVGGLITYANFSPTVLLFIALMLLVVRPVSVLTTFWGKGVAHGNRAYVAWFGIRGIGSLYYLFYALQHGVKGDLARDLVGITLAVIAVSVIVHGISVTPIMNRYTKKKEEKQTPAGAYVS